MSSGDEAQTYVALLRGINVGGRKLVAMAELTRLCVDLGLTAPRSLLQSGNLVFAAEPGRATELETRLEREVLGRFGHSVSFLLRTAAEWRTIIAANPYPEASERDPAHVLVVLLRAVVSVDAVAALRASIRGPERIEVRGREAFVVYPDGIARSKLTLDRIERHLGTIGTARNWNTMRKLLAML